jgi:hypothetical protein
VVDFLRDFYGIEIQLDRKALEAASVESDSPITRNFEGTTLRSALDSMLEGLRLVWFVRDETLRITTPERAASVFHTRLHPIGESAGMPAVTGGDALGEAIRRCVTPGTAGLPHGWAILPAPGRQFLIVYQSEAGHLQLTETLGLLRDAIRRDPAGRLTPRGQRLGISPAEKKILDALDRVRRDAASGPG